MLEKCHMFGVTLNLVCLDAIYLKDRAYHLTSRCLYCSARFSFLPRVVALPVHGNFRA
jgi:hypothetical protein